MGGIGLGHRGREDLVPSIRAVVRILGPVVVGASGLVIRVEGSFDCYPLEVHGSRILEILDLVEEIVGCVG